MERAQHTKAIGDLVAAVTGSPGHTSATERRAMFDGTEIAGPLSGYSVTVRSASFRITDSDVDRLREAGVDEDAILEATLASAVGAAMAILQRGLLGMEGN